MDKNLYICNSGNDFLNSSPAIDHFKNKEEELRKKTEQLNFMINIFNSLEEAYFSKDMVNNKTLAISPSFEKMYGVPAEKHFENPDYWFERVHPDDIDLINQSFPKLIKGEFITHEYRLIREDGDMRWVYARINPVLDSNGKLVRLDGVSTDITNKKNLESQLSSIQRLEGLGTLAGGIAHDLNNAITPILISVEILEMKNQDEKSKKLLNSIKESAKHSADLVKKILTFASGVEGKKEVLNLSKVILEPLNIIKSSISKDISIKTNISDKISNISGDLTQLNQVIINLIVNARDAMPNGGSITISAKNEYIDEAFTKMNKQAKVGKYIILSVSDTGTGIPDKIKDRIFEPFFTTKEVGKGTGLGLSTILGVIKSHGGFINVSSRENKGTVFNLYLPAVDQDTEPEEYSQNADFYKGNGEFILVVDDEKPIREVLSTTLSEYNYNVITADDGAEAIVHYLQNSGKIKVVITDMSMPVMNGIATIHVLRNINPDVKIIAASGLKKEEEIKSQVGNQLIFLAKPYLTIDLLKAIQELINK